MASEFRGRTHTKLEYARLHLKEIQSRDKPVQDDFARAHQESVLFHIVGAKDSFLQEINAAYGHPLKPVRVNEERLDKELKRWGVQSHALSHLRNLESDKTSWLAEAIDLRNQGTHGPHIRHAFHQGDEFNGKVFFTNPRTEEEIPIVIESYLADCIERMEKLTEDLRCMLEIETQSQAPPIVKL